MLYFMPFAIKACKSRFVCLFEEFGELGSFCQAMNCMPQMYILNAQHSFVKMVKMAIPAG